MKILLVEDDTILAQVITQQLTTQQYIIDWVIDGSSGWSYASTFDYDLLILDLKLPQMNGIHLCQQLRTEGDTTPILLLTSEDDHATKIQALDAGADDYMIKPFDIGELAARIRALFRRGQGQALPLRIWGELLLNPSTGEVNYGEHPLKLTGTEYKLLELLLLNGIHVVSTDEILERLWSSNEFPAESTVRSHVRRLRNKLQKAGAPVDFISTLHGRGYYLKPSEELETFTTNVDATHVAEITTDYSQAPPHLPTSSDPSSSHSIQYLQFLNETWPTAQQTCLNLLEQLEQSLPQERADIAHRLAGTLGTFGLGQAYQQARLLENLSKQASGEQLRLKTENREFEHQFQVLLRSLQCQIQMIHRIDSLQELSQMTQVEPRPKLWLLGHSPELSQGLERAIAARGLTSAHLETSSDCLEQLAHSFSPHNIIIANLEALQAIGPDSPITKNLQLTPPSQTPLSLLHSNSPVNTLVSSLIVLGDQDTFENRLQALRWGGRFLSWPHTSLEAIIDTALATSNTNSRQSLSPFPRQHTPLKIMLVDDDPHWLKSLLKQLSPLGFKVTTLADPTLFWTVLQSVKPDALVLDIKIPEVNGLELCQLVRNDPQWQRLPIFFLSILNDFETRQTALSMGADDYFFKPIIGKELAHCILHRLERIRILAT